MKYAFIRANIADFSVRLMCRVLVVSPSGYYEWRQRKPSRRSQEDAHLTTAIRQVFEANRCRTGSIRVAKHLQAMGTKICRNRVARLMRLAGLRARASKKFKATTNSNHKLPTAPNLLQQDFSASKPNSKWVSDITYIWTDEGWLYLATVLDLYSRMLIGWSMADRMHSKLVVDALQMALWNRKMPKDVIVLSDNYKLTSATTTF